MTRHEWEHDRGSSEGNAFDGGEHDHAELGALVLGLLDEAQAHATEEHIASCESCRREWEELREMANLLDDLPPEALLEGPPDSDLLVARTVRQVRAEVKARRRRRIGGMVAAAAVVVAAVLGGGVVVGRATAPPSTTQLAAGTVTVAGNGTGGVTLAGTVSPAADWVRVAVTVKGVPVGTHCRMVVVGKDGAREVAGSWTVGQRGEESGITVDGAADITLTDVASVNIENANGEVFVSAIA